MLVLLFLSISVFSVLTSNMLYVPPNVSSFYMSITPALSSVVAGNFVSAKLAITRLGLAKPVNLSIVDCPPNATCSLSKKSGQPPYKSTLYVTTSAYTPADKYNITVIGTSGSVTKFVIYKVTVKKAPFDFKLHPDPEYADISPGGIATTKMNATMLSGIPEKITLSVLGGCPPSATCTIDPPTVLPPGVSASSVAILDVNTTGLTPPGPYKVTVMGTGGGISRNGYYYVNVTANAAASPN